MNVLVYSGPEVLQSSLNHTLTTLRSLLLPHYTVQPITAPIFLDQPWSTSCALLVVPACTQPFTSPANALIMDYVKNGGRFLGISAGAECSSSSILAPSTLPLGLPTTPGQKTLRFSDKITGTYIYPSLGSAPPATARHVRLLGLRTGTILRGIYQLGTHQFSGLEKMGTGRILARYALEDGTEDTPAAVICDSGAGRIALWGPSPEFSLVAEPASATASAAGLIGENLTKSEDGRKSLLKETLEALGLKLPVVDLGSVISPLPQFFTCNPQKPSILSVVVQALGLSLNQPATFEDANDNFSFQPLSERTSGEIQQLRAQQKPDPKEWQPKQVYLCSGGRLPPSQDTPLFDLGNYYESLAQARSREGTLSTTMPWGIGEVIAYSEAVTSTQTMLDKNPRLLSLLPTPFVSIASYQLAGRGRGSNVWVSPAGLLQFSVHVRVALASFPASKLVFVQYLFGLAVVEACREDVILGSFGDRVRLKWPNDIYAVAGEENDKSSWKKIGGILVNTSFSGGKVDIVIGCGLDVLNAPPIMSLAQLIPPGENRTLMIEKTAAVMLAKFESMWNAFTTSGGSFGPFLSLYLERWLHSDQVITLTTVTPHRQVRISTITLDHGLLRTVPERIGWSGRGEEEFIDLQPDGNSFDLMSGLIKLKT
ncbi:class II aaRS and biotin synthetase [Pluteus cervinus]|uniref:Class II aaRS and biotin synthetase n=1 Tax=Pluteus cervinus TaxID=181527 RepID=A0ACD3BBB3_9AGAR|nr:class II aaRS and biotin synthetase [Pluteus cervinus]